MIPADPQADAHALYQTALKLFGQGRPAEGAPLLGRAAEAGHVGAMSMLGGQLLSGRGAAPDPISGVRLIMAAAERGGGYACAMAAMLLASGVGGTDWPRALDYLQRSAELGFPSAQAQLQLLAGRGGQDWGRLRRAVSLDAWRTAPKPLLLSEAPQISAFASVLPPAVCDWIIARGRERLGPAQVYDPSSGGPMRGEERRNSAAEFALADMDVVLLAVRERLAAASGLSVSGMQGPQVLHYAVGERFTPHFDFLDPDLEGPARDIIVRGQRVATCLVYLNDDLEGGETEFPELGLRHRGARGDALVFRNLDAEGRPDRRTLHAGLAPTAGEKWVLSQWVRDRVPPGLGDPRLVAALKGL
ncbi:MAG: 2OG-Fe(II) oxygenase [Caulobacteraceae bacterium]